MKKYQEQPTEDWRKLEYTEDPDNAPEKFKCPPKKYEKGFLIRLDKRHAAFKTIFHNYQEIMGDLGGRDSLSHIQQTLVERFVFLEFVLRNLEQKIAEQSDDKTKEKGVDVEKLFSRWVQGLNSLTGLAKVVGVERRAKQIRSSLKEYVKSKKKHQEPVD